MSQLREIEKQRNVKVIYLHQEELRVSDFDEIKLILFVVDNKNDAGRRAMGCDKDRTLLVECYNYQDKQSRAELILNYLEVNIKDIEYKYIKCNQEIHIKNEN